MSESADQVRLIQDQLQGLVHWLPQADAFLYPVTDSLLLLEQRPNAVSFWSAGPVASRLFCSWADCSGADHETASSVAVSSGALGKTGYAVLVERLDGGRLLPDLEATARARRALLQQASEGIPDQGEFLDFLTAALRLQEEGPSESDETGVESIDDWRESKSTDLEPMRGVLDEALSLVASSPRLKKPLDSHKGPSLLDLVAVFGSGGLSAGAPRALEAGARRLLSQSQKDAIAEWLECGETEFEPFGEPAEFLSSLEDPYSPAVRPVLLNTLRRGVVGIDFGHSQVEGGQLGRAALSPAYARLTELLSPTRPPQRLIIPVHVGGVPWIALVHHTDFESVGSWSTNYHLYRSVFPRLATALRSGAKHAYLERVGQILVEELRRRPNSPLEFSENANVRWDRLARSYPFERIELSQTLEGDPAKAVVELPAGSRFTVRLQSILRPVLQYDPLDVEEVRSTCQRAIEDFLRSEAQSQLRAVAGSTHIIATRLGALQGIVESIEEEPTRLAAARLMKQVRALERFSNYLLRPEGKRGRKPIFQAVSPAELLTMVNEELSFTLKVLGGPFQPLQDRNLVADIQEQGGDEVLEFQSRSEMEHVASLNACLEQVEVVVDGLLTNALKYSDPTAPGIRLSLGLSEDEGLVEAVLSVTNRSLRSGDRLLALAGDLNAERDPAMMGINLLEMACRACAYSAPRWSVDTGRQELTATAVVASGKRRER